MDSNGDGCWKKDEIEPIQEQCLRYGLELCSMMIALNWLISPMLDKKDKDRRIDNICRSIRAAGELGVSMMEWRWSPDFKWGDDMGYNEAGGRGGAICKAFDRNSSKHKPPFPELGVIACGQMWERHLYFSDPLMKMAEEAGVKISLHPKDQLVKAMHGISRVLTNTGEIMDFLEVVDSPANEFSLC